MIQNVLRHIGGIENYGLISILLFVGCFLGVLLWAWSLRKNYIEKMENLPLEDDPAEDAQAPDTNLSRKQ